MIRNYTRWQNFENKLRKKQKVNIKENFALMDAMYKEAVALKILPLKDLLEDLAVKIKFAKAVNSVPAAAHKIRQRA
ncbi:MAG: hypothetical protein HY920_04380 [Elusimicrobia bacterium]|nr:hypothetical protein [Elusimicrobiota bacterium]